ncbi:MAG: RDD family protein, partial [Taibaiella sp.]|nr:RDD family protein [Taibaiella sp.]
MLYTTSPTTGYRFLSMLIDFLIFMVAIWILSMIFLLPNMPNMAEMMEPSHEPPNFNFWPSKFIYLTGAMYAIYFCKDNFNGKSPGKKIMGLQVVNNKTMQPANPWRCIVRNLFCIFWPIEFIVALANPGRRIGDFVAGTAVVSYEEIISENEAVEYVSPPSPKYMQAILSYIVTAMMFSFLSIQWTN